MAHLRQRKPIDNMGSDTVTFLEGQVFPWTAQMSSGSASERKSHLETGVYLTPLPFDFWLVT